jgi:imidazolonepropionase-like amidohydrolase
VCNQFTIAVFYVAEEGFFNPAESLMATRSLVMFLLLMAANCADAMARDVWIQNVTIVSAERAEPLAGANVKIHDGRVSEISRSPLKGRRSDASIIDGKGLFLTPGLIDGHVHLGEIPGMLPEQEKAHADIARSAREQFPKSYLYFGFTTLVDLNSNPEDIADWNSHPLHPDTFFCGAAMIMDGYPMSFVPKPIRYRLARYFLIEPGDESALPQGIDPAEHTPAAVVARMKRDGAICVKTHYEHGFGAIRDLRVPKVETIQALVHEAHAANLPVLLHANSTDAQAFGIEAGVDVMAHGQWNWNTPNSVTELTPEVTKVLQAVIDAKRGYQPTIQVLYGERDLFDDAFLSDPKLALAVPAGLIDWYRSPEGQWYHDRLAKIARITPGVKPDVDGKAIARVNHVVEFLAAHAVRLSFGSDTPSDETYANPPGLNGWLEMHKLVDSGVSPAQLFTAATLTNAQIFGLSGEIGTVEVGKRANLLLLSADPMLTLHAFDRIQKIILHGNVMAPDALAANRSNAPAHP